MKRNKNSFPGIPRHGKTSSSENALTENVEILTGARGSNRALLLSDLVNLDTMKRQSLIRAANGNTGGLPVVPGGGIEPPHSPVNLQGVGGFTFIAITWEPASYKGHAYAEIFRSDTDDFSVAVRIATEVTDIFSDTVNMGSKYYYWVRFVNKADMHGPTQGAAGLLVETQQSAEQILSEIGGLIEKSHLGDFLTTEVEKLPDIGEYIDQIKIDMPPLKAAIPTIEHALFNADGVVEKVKQEALEAKSTSESVLSNNEALALNLIDAALLSDINWGNNTVNLAALNASIEGVQATINSNFYTMAEADRAIAAAATTIQAMIEENGTSLSGDISLTYYTKVSADEAIALADTALKSAIEDPLGSSIGATLNNDYYTAATTNEAIAAAGDTLKTSIEDPNGSSVGATLFTNYYTKTAANTAIAEADLVLKGIIEDINGSSLGATLYNGYYTKVNTNDAIASASTNLKTAIEDPEGDSLGATLFNYYETKVDNESAVAKSIFELSSEFNEGLEATLENALAGDIEADRQRVISADFIASQKTFADDTQALTETLQLLEAQFGDSNSSVLKLTQSIANNMQATASDLLRLTSSIKGVSADLVNYHYTKVTADEAISQSTKTLKAAIEDPEGDSVGADLDANYYTKVTANEAISSANTSLKSKIEDPEGDSIGADLLNNHYTKVTADEAITAAINILKSAIENPNGTSVGANLVTNYYTKTNANTAISEAVKALQAAIEDPNGSSISARLKNDFYTIVTADEAISSANTKLQSLIENPDGSSVGAALHTLSETVVENDKQWAMWGVKTTVAEVTASFGLVNDGDDPIFAVKGAKLAIITSQDPNVLTPVFTVVDDKTVMKSALIDEAHIQSLVTDDLLSNRVVIGSKLTTPSINYDPVNGARSQNFSMSPNGVMHAKSAVLESVVIKDADGNVVMSSTGAIAATNVSGLGTLATLDGLGYDALTGLPTLGTLSTLDTLGYDALTERPTLGTLSALDTLGYDALTGKPTLGSLAALDAVSYDAVTGTPTLGPFAGLQQLLKTNISTYIESGAIGSAQIDTAWIAELFGINASFLGTVYAEKIEGDLVDGDILNIPAESWGRFDANWHTLSTFQVERNAKYDQWLNVPLKSIHENNVTSMTVNDGLPWNGLVLVTKGEGTLSITIKAKGSSANTINIYESNIALMMFRKGSGFIV